MLARDMSGLLPIVASEEVVFLRSAVDNGGDSGSFLLDVVRESHEKGLVSFLEVDDGGGNDACFSFSFSGTGGAAGGGENLTGDMLPESPCSPLAESRPRVGSSATPSSRDTSSNDVTDMRCAVRSGDFEGDSPLDFCVSGVSGVLSGVSFTSCAPSLLGTSGMGETVRMDCVVEDDEVRLLSSDRERSACEVGRGVMSGASWNVSCRNT
jgi:hypothetical protein